ncbi:MAG: hypothetical protein MUD01_20950 [Chloroflexaceae bacterium]|nr:hypothetical protein [Chloroflexaceae bacterium]
MVVEKAGLVMAVAVLILGVAVMFQTRGGEIGNSLVQVFTCQLGRFGAAGAGCGSATAANNPVNGVLVAGPPTAPSGTTTNTLPNAGSQPAGTSTVSAALSAGAGGGGGSRPTGNPFANFTIADWIQLGLDLFGFVPGFGEVADLINAIISALRGDWAGAAASVAAMWPAGGQAATIAKISAKYGDEVAAVIRNLDEAVTGARRSGDEAASGANAARRFNCVASGPPLIAIGSVALVSLVDAIAAPAQSTTCNVTLRDGRTIALRDGARITTSDALDSAETFLGPGYRDLGNGRFVSADGLRQVRMGDNDILGRHGGGPHMNFETLEPNPLKPGKMRVKDDLHIYLLDP